MSAFEVVFAYVGAAATKSVLIGLIILATASLFTPIDIQYPMSMAIYLVLVAIAFSLAGFIIGIWARGFEELQFIPMLIVTPLTFLGFFFFSIDILPGLWRTLSLFNPIVYLVSGFRWSFHGSGDVSIGVSLAVLTGFLTACLAIVWWIFRTGYRLKS